MITDRLYDLARKSPDAPFLFWNDKVFSFGAMADLVTAYASELADNGIVAGQHVALLCGNRPAFLVAWFALTELGAVTVPLNTSLVGDGLRYSLSQSESVALLIEPALLAEKREDLALLPQPVPILLVDEPLETLSSPAMPRNRLSEGRPDAANMILYTSGTTGLPKGAVVPNEAFIHAGDDMSRSLALTDRDRIMVFLPLFHANPQMYAVSSSLATGAAIVLIERFSATDFIPTARRYGATGFTFVGTVLSILDKRHPKPEHDHRLRFGVGGGAAPQIWRNIEEKFGLTVRELYGMTETGGWVTMNTVDENRFGSVGAPRRGVRIRVVDETDTDVPVGEKGEVIAFSERPNLFFSGYWKKPEITGPMMAGGWLHTGDRGWLDEDGFLYFDSRMKELIRRGGEMISPAEIELQLLRHPAVRDCAVVGVPDDVLGEEIQAVVVLAGEAEPASLRAFLVGKIPTHMLPRYLTFADAIPKTETQKIKRHELLALDGEVFDLAPARTKEGQSA